MRAAQPWQCSPSTSALPCHAESLRFRSLGLQVVLAWVLLLPGHAEPRSAGVVGAAVRAVQVQGLHAKPLRVERHERAQRLQRPRGAPAGQQVPGLCITRHRHLHDTAAVCATRSPCPRTTCTGAASSTAACTIRTAPSSTRPLLRCHVWHIVGLRYCLPGAL